MLDIQLSWELLSLLFAVAVLAGFVDTIAGGGGLITIPTLLLAQVPPVNALATNKLQGSFGTMVASINMLRRRIIHFGTIKKAALASFIGATIGTIVVQFIDKSALSFIIPIVLIGIGLYFLLVPGAGQFESKPRVKEETFTYAVVPSIAFYDGVLGPGTGSFFSLAGVALRGQQIVQATARAKVFNFASNIASTIVFIFSGHVVWAIGLVMMIGQVIGASLGSRVVISHGTRLIRPLIVLVCFLMVVRYLYDMF